MQNLSMQKSVDSSEESISDRVVNSDNDNLSVVGFELTSRNLEKSFQSGKLREFFNQLCVSVSTKFTKEVPLESPEGEEVFSESLIVPIEQFVFGNCKTLDDFAAEFEKTNKQKPIKCGRIFSNGEPHYSCRECSVDPTCVLCAQCFQASEHQTHKYRIGTSSGGGCCDCGDEEAWKTHPYCSHHQPTEDCPDGETSLLPDEVHVRVKTMLRLIVDQFIFYLSIYTDKFDPSHAPNGSDEQCVVLYNDELHTFEQVIESLKRALLCDSTRAKAVATAVDKEGRHLVFRGRVSECEKVRTKIDDGIKKASATLSRKKPIHILVMMETLFNMQNVVQKLLQWMVKITSKLGQFRRIFCDLLLSENYKPGQTIILETTLLNDTRLWKSVRSDWHGMLIKTFLIDSDHKKQFAIYFVTHYNRIMKDYANDEHHHNTSVSALTVQIFTVPSIAKYLIFHADALYIVLDTLVSSCTTESSNGSSLTFEMKKLKSNFYNYHYCTYHITYLLHNQLDGWDDEKRRTLFRAFLLYAKLLASMENQVSVKRELKHHIEVEPEWEPVMRLELNLSSVHSQMLDIVSSDDQLLIECILVASNILERQSRKNSVETDKKKFGGVQTKCIANPVETNPVSVHLQLHRILAALVGRACHVLSARNEDDWYGNLRIAFCHIPYDQLMEPCLRVIVLAAQVIHANMWKRNGFSLVNQIHLYNRISGRVHMYNQDIAMLQICACKTPSMDEFLIHLLNKFHLKLLDWFEPRQEQHVSLEDLSKTYLALIEEFLYLVIVLLSERHTVLTEKFEKDADLQSELLHILLMGVHSHSEIVKKVTLRDEVAEIDENLHLVADFDPKSKKFKAKKEVKERLFNPMCYHLSRSELSTIEANILTERKENNLPEYVEPSILPSIRPELRTILSMFDSDVLIFILHTLLRRALYMSDRFYSENIVHFSVYIIAMGINEEMQQLNQKKRVPNDASPELNFTHKCFNFTGGNVHTEKYNSVAFYLKELLKTDSRVDCYKPLIRFVLDQQKKVALKRAELQPDNQSGLHESLTMDCEPVTSNGGSIQRNAEGSTERNRKRQRELAKRTRELAMEAMRSAQSAFTSKHSYELDHIVSADVKDTAVDSMSLQASTVLLGAECTKLSAPKTNTELCLVCKSDRLILFGSQLDSTTSTTPVDRDSPRDVAEASVTAMVSEPDTSMDTSGSEPYDPIDELMVQIAFIQRTTLWSQSKDSAHQLPTGDELDNYDPIPPMATLPWGSLVTSCGHNLHYGCWQKYFKNLVKDEQSRMGIRRLTMSKSLGYNLEKGEFLCPMCGAIANATIPLIQPEILEPYSKISPKINDLKTADDVQSYFDMLHEFSNFGCTRSDVMSSPTVFENMTGIEKGSNERFEQLADNVERLLKHFAESVYIKGLEVNPVENNPRIPVVVWNSVATTILAQEYSCRFSQKSLFAQSMREENLEYLCRNLMLMPKLSAQYLNFSKKHLLTLFRKIFLDFSPSAFLYEYDLFYYMVYMVSSLHLLHASDPSQVSVPAANMFMRRSVYKFILVHFVNLHVTQVLLKMAQDIAANEEQPMLIDDPKQSNVDDSTANSEDSKKSTAEMTILDVFNLLVERCGLKLPPKSVTLSRVLSRLEVCLVPWLRCAALFFKSMLMAGPTPTKLENDDNNLELLCQYLGIPHNLEDLIKPLEKSLLNATSLTPYVLGMCDSMRCDLALNSHVNVSYPLEPIQLIELPHDYVQLINQPIKLCPSTGNTMRCPAICMVCREVICSGSLCCQIEEPETNQVKGACMQHVEKCTRASGLFLRPLECRIMFISAGGKGCFYGAPYVDEYGETDSSLKRGNPLFLNEEMLNNLKRIWYSQSIAETVSRQLSKANARLQVFDWNEM